MAAGLRPVKNIGYALEAFALFKKKHPQARLLLAGPCLDADESERVLAAGERIEGFSYCGELPHARVLELMQAADIFLNTSLQEGMPGAVMEAMAAGLAVIATDVAGNRALIENMRTGILVPLHAPGALLEACEILAANTELRQQLGRQAREEVRARYGCDAELQAPRSSLRQRAQRIARLFRFRAAIFHQRWFSWFRQSAALTMERPAAPLSVFMKKTTVSSCTMNECLKSAPGGRQRVSRTCCASVSR